MYSVLLLLMTCYCCYWWRWWSSYCWYLLFSIEIVDIICWPVFDCYSTVMLLLFGDLIIRWLPSPNWHLLSGVLLLMLLVTYLMTDWLDNSVTDCPLVRHSLEGDDPCSLSDWEANSVFDVVVDPVDIVDLTHSDVNRHCWNPVTSGPVGVIYSFRWPVLLLFQWWRYDGRSSHWWLISLILTGVTWPIGVDGLMVTDDIHCCGNQWLKSENPIVHCYWHYCYWNQYSVQYWWLILLLTIDYLLLLLTLR